MKLRKHLALSLSVQAASALFAAVPAAYGDDDNNPGPYKLIATVPISGGLASFDISWVDSGAGRYYLADRGTASRDAGIDVIDTRTLKVFSPISIKSSGGTNGVLLIRRAGDDEEGGPAGTLVVGGNDSNTYFVDLKRDLATELGTPVPVSTGGLVRADELAYDPKHEIILITNPDEASAKPTPGVPFVSFISAKTRKVVGKIIYDGKAGHGPNATAGIEQPVWNGRTGKFYINIPATPANPAGEVDEIDPVTMKVTNTFSTPCAPVPPLGLALIPGQRLMNSCGDVVDIASQKVVQKQTGIFADEIWFNPGDERVYFGSFVNSPVVEGIPPYNVIPGGLPWAGSIPAKFSHSVAADSVRNRVFVPVTNTGVLVFGYANDDGSDN